MLPHGGLGKATLTLAFPAGTHKVVAKCVGSATVTGEAERQVRAHH